MISFDDVETLITKRASPGIRPGLERMERLLSVLGGPQGAYPAIHVVGTNGKGSTCAFLASVFQAAGYKTGLYTSPHLESPGERLTVDGRLLSPERWMACAEKVAEAVSRDDSLRADPPSYFELVTAAAFLLAAEEKVDIAVVEAGLGGRLDATSLLTDVVCTGAASISMDHTEYLGNTLQAIAGEKFAVVRAGVPACYLGDNESLIPLFERFCRDAKAEPFVVSRDAVLGGVAVTEDGCVFDFSAGGLELKRVRTRMLGRHQALNAALALSVLSRVTDCAKFSRLTEDTIRAGILNARWPGRLEIVSGGGGKSPLVVLDGGHNPDGVAKLAESVTELWGDKKIGVVYAAMKDKDYPACIEILGKLGAAFYATAVPGAERSLTAEDAASAPRKELVRGAFENPLAAIAEASRDNDVVLVCGSLYLIGWARPRVMR
ncbi:MAG: bifunctional folylpolyglutamate synthase/dihydrofolate synthase [Synergistaceae bacterium]|nr:bifunctional folylpolyglutamate synthase/dihydrofolate synthase [Synergistaceae bacterium]